MNVRLSSVSRRTLSILLTAIIAILAPAVPFGAPPVRPDPRSPLAIGDRFVYAVDADRRTLIAYDLGTSEWSVVATIPGADIRGLAWAASRLYFTNVADRSVGSVATAGGDRPITLIHRGQPLQRPTDLTFSDALVVAD